MIWLDLDGTLAWTSPAAAFKGAAVRTAEFPLNGEIFVAVARAGAVEFVAALRSLGPTKLLTFARRAYAHAVCQACGLPFDHSDIVAQEEWWGGFLSGPLKRSRVQSSPAIDVLVANNSDITNDQKMGWLGEPAKLVLIPDFLGVPDGFETTWPTYFATVQQAHAPVYRA